MIIECPSCNTKFAIDPTQLSGVSTPRFHCSRCDYFFETRIDGSAASTLTALTDTVKSRTAVEVETAEVKPAETETSPEDSIKKESPEQLDLLDIPNVLEGDESDERYSVPEGGHVSLLLESDAATGLKARWPDSMSSTEVEVDMSEMRKKIWSVGTGQRLGLDAACNPDASQGSVSGSGKSNSKENTGASAGVAQTFGASLLDRDLLDRDLLDREPFEKQLRQLDAKLAAPNLQGPAVSLATVPLAATSITVAPEARVKSGPGAADKLAVVWQEHKEVSFGEREIENRRRSKVVQRLNLSSINFSATRIVLSVASVPLMLLFGFWIWSNNLHYTPAPLKRALRLDSNGLPQLAPPGLEVVELSSSLLPLDNGRKVIEIRGELLNATTRTFADVRLDARVFDSENKQLERLLVNAKNELEGAQVQSLTEPTLSELQKKQTASGISELLPSSRTPFRIIFTGLNEEAKWFSTRIYSTRALS